MNCQRCNSDRIAKVNGKTSDRCYVSIGFSSNTGYVPFEMNIGGGYHVRFSYCLECGQMQGVFPLPQSELEKE